MKKLIVLLSLALWIPAASFAATVYNNTTTDTFLTYFGDVNNATEVGDTVTLEGSERLLQTATVQFYNLGTLGSFDALLRFYDGTSQIGGPFTISDIAIDEGGTLDVTFSNLNLLVPSTLGFTIEVTNQLRGASVGLNAFKDGTIGTSDAAAILFRSGGVLQSGATGDGEGNLYLILTAENATSDVPEPSTIALTAGAALLIAVRARRRK